MRCLTSWGNLRRGDDALEAALLVVSMPVSGYLTGTEDLHLSQGLGNVSDLVRCGRGHLSTATKLHGVCLVEA